MKASQKEFIAEAEDLIEESQKFILEIQDTISSGLNPDTINALFRSMHTLKGLSGLFGLQGIMSISHALESLMDEVRLGKIPVNDKVVGFLLNNLDVLKNLVAMVSRDEEEGDVSAFLDNIEAFRNSQKGRAEGAEGETSIDQAIMKVLSEYEEHRLKSNIKDGKGIFLVRAAFPLEVFDTSLEKLTKIIKSKGELISTLPTSSDVPEGSIGFNLMFGTGIPLEEIQKEVNFDIDVLVKPRDLQPQAESMLTAPKPLDTHLKSTSTTVRVDIDKLDLILNTIGELTLAKGAVKRIGTELHETYGQSALVNDIHKIHKSLERRLEELQHQVLEIRMVPIGQIFSRLSQIVRRYSREIGKQIELTVFGEDTELDKYLAEEIVDPLMHLIRNSIDHGIEVPEERKKKGKNEFGTIILNAYQKGNYVVVEVKDDGSGIDTGIVRKKAIEKGLIAVDAELTEKEIIDFIFTPGFSTKDIISEVSGRGVGMDVVKSTLSTLGGFVEVETARNSGSTFFLTLPITLAIIKALIVRVGQERFAVPLTSMSETLIIRHTDLQTIEGKEVYYLRGEMLHMVRVNKFFNIEGDKTDRSFGVVVGFGERRVGLMVDELFGQHEIVIKGLGDYLKQTRGFAGAAEIGKHEVILVLDTEFLIEESGLKQKGAAYV